MSESFIDVDTSDAVEPMVVDDGEYKIRLIGYRTQKDESGEEKILRTDKNGGKYLMPIFDFPEEIAARSFSHFLRIPNADTMDAKQLNGAKWELEVFKKAFTVEGGFNPEDLVGRETWALIRKVDDVTYGEQNALKKFITGA
jgi:hypothetical protein